MEDIKGKARLAAIKKLALKVGPGKGRGKLVGSLSCVLTGGVGVECRGVTPCEAEKTHDCWQACCPAQQAAHVPE